MCTHIHTISRLCVVFLTISDAGIPGSLVSFTLQIHDRPQITLKAAKVFLEKFGARVSKNGVKSRLGCFGLRKGEMKLK